MGTIDGIKPLSFYCIRNDESGFLEVPIIFLDK